MNQYKIMLLLIYNNNTQSLHGDDIQPRTCVADTWNLHNWMFQIVRSRWRGTAAGTYNMQTVLNAEYWIQSQIYKRMIPM